eukprot:635952-Pyramimonas_sp.AAC.1
MAAVKELRAELVITGEPLKWDRHADDTDTAIAIFGPSAYAQVKGPVSNGTAQEEGHPTLAILIADASASQLQAALAAAASGTGPCKIMALTGQG